MIRSPNPSALMRTVFRWQNVVVALSMILVARSGAGDGALHAMRGAYENNVSVAEYSLGAKHDLGSPTLSLDSTKDCQVLYAWGVEFEQDGRDQEAYDTLRKFVESCPWHPYAPNAFGTMDGPASHLASKDPAIWNQYREWLESVLYLNTINPQYFCACVESISGTMYSDADTTFILRLEGTNRSLAIIKWLLDNTDCDTAMNRMDYDQSRASQIATWKLDTSKPLDTTLPSMHDLGLDTLLAKHALYQNQKSVKLGSDVVTSAIAAPNPTNTGTVLAFGMAQSAYVRVELYDLLGNIARNSSFEQYLGVGNHSVPIDMSALPSGTYYARIVTAYGETRTVKIVRE
jgi:hypothetical protein